MDNTKGQIWLIFFFGGFFLLTILVVIALGYKYYWLDLRNNDVLVPTTPEHIISLDNLNFGLETGLRADEIEDLGGRLVFTSRKIDEKGVEPLISLFTLEPATGDVWEIGAEDDLKFSYDFMQYGDDLYEIYLTVDTSVGTDSPDFIKPQLNNINEQKLLFINSISGINEGDFAFSPDDKLVAFAQQAPEFVDALDWDDLSTWQVVVNDFVSGEDIIIIDGAGDPNWINEGKDLLYVKTDGLYKYNLETGVEHLVYSDFINLNYLTEIDASRSSTNSPVVMTIPDLNSIVLLGFKDPDTMATFGIIQSQEVEYESPQVFEDGLLYAVLARSETKEDIIQIRNFVSREVIKEIPMFNFTKEGTSLNAWTY